MDRVILMCGAAGSGKSTHARGLAAAGYVVLSFDAEAWDRGYREHPLEDSARAEVQRSLQGKLIDSLARGECVVVDSSFWSRSSRDEYRRLLAPCGVEPVVHYLDTPRDVVLARLARRSGTDPDDVLVPQAQALAYLDGFETPTPAEGPLRIVGHPPREARDPEVEDRVRVGASPGRSVVDGQGEHLTGPVP
ncbi:AAA family ATPase [Cellulomonas composti]|nr:ATP-binding protein [Cellulomonas composti]